MVHLPQWLGSGLQNRLHWFQVSRYSKIIAEYGKLGLLEAEVG
jgi:hypothetical protein